MRTMTTASPGPISLEGLIGMTGVTGKTAAATPGGYTLDELFPEVNPGMMPAGYKVLVQVRKVFGRTKGGVLLADDTKDADAISTVTAKVVAVGPGAFFSRTTGTMWPGAPYCEAGQYVRIPRYGGDRFKVKDASGEDVWFAILNDEDIIAIVTKPEVI